MFKHKHQVNIVGRCLTRVLKAVLLLDFDDNEN